MARTRYLVTYDVVDDRRRGRIHDVLRDFGDRLQYSVFRCDLGPRELVRLRELLHEAVHHTEDQVLFVDLGPAESRLPDRVEVLGRAVAPIRRARIV